PLAPATVKGIANLVAGSVESLRPESVVILDTYGRPLTKPSEGADSADAGAQSDRQQQIERDLTTRVVALLESAVGVGRVRVNVAAFLNTEAVEETAEVFDPATVVRSRQTSTETGSVAGSTGGVAGARANQPAALSTASAPAPVAGSAPPAASAAAAAVPPTSLSNAIVAITTPVPPGKTTETTNYE